MKQKWSPKCLHHRSRRLFGARLCTALQSIHNIGIPFHSIAHLKQTIDGIHCLWPWKKRKLCLSPWGSAFGVRRSAMFGRFSSICCIQNSKSVYWKSKINSSLVDKSRGPSHVHVLCTITIVSSSIYK